jgi:acetolactate synthase-1/2/3 large subunit
MPTGGEILIQTLAAEGIRHVFTVPGESFIAALDAMHGTETIRPITCRHEGAAAMMAEATGKLTGTLVTRGPGATNAASGVYVAHEDATPMLLLVGLPPRAANGQPVFQAIDLPSLFGGLSKWCAVVPSAARLQDYVHRALATARAGRGGPVVLGLPEDVLSEVASPMGRGRTEVPRVELTSSQLGAIRTLLAHAERPLVIIGGSDWSAGAAAAVLQFAQRFDLPVLTSFRRQDHIDNRHPCYAGHAGLNMDATVAAALRISDVVIALGTRLGDVSTRGFSLLSDANPGQKLVHIAPDAGAPDTLYAHALALPVPAADAAIALSGLDTPGKTPPWPVWRRDLRKAYEDSIKPRRTPGPVRLEEIIATLSAMLPDDAIITNGAGNYAAFLHRYFVYKGYPSQLAPVSGSMGYGLPAAIAAKLAYPGRTVVALAGDGCYQMTGADLITAVQFATPILVIVVNNGTLGTVRMHQERRYPGRVVATSLINPDFVAQARAAGALAERIEDTAAFAPALERALVGLHQGRSALIELATEADAISPQETLSQIRDTATIGLK